jgi:hypothetical protein
MVGVLGSEVQGSGFWVLGSRVQGSRFWVQRFWVQGFRVQGFKGSAQPPAKKTVGLIEKETLKKRISNVEVRYSVYFIKND